MPGIAQPPTVLIVDDDLGLLRLIEKALRREGILTATISSGAEALAWMERNSADLLLLDLKLQDLSASELVRRLSQSSRPLPFVIITGQGDERVAVDMMKLGARDYLIKDADFLQFVPEVVKHVLEQIGTERRLAEAEERVRLVQNVVDRGFSAVLIADAEAPDPRILYINPSFAQLTGASPDEVVGRPLSALEAMSGVLARLRRGLPESERLLEEISPYKTSEGERWGEWRVGPLKDKNGKITHWLVILRDMTDRKRLEKEILEIRDREQRRIGQDLHDGLCQQLAGIELMSQALEQKIAARSKSDAARAGEISGHVREAIRQTRLLARGLSPVTLESEGLVSALQELVLSTESLFHVACHFECEPVVEIGDPAVATHLFRIAQESVSNAVRHGKATRITIRLSAQAGRIRLEISDNGTGLPHPLPKNRGMGLRIMESRAGMIGGTLLMENNPAGGARVACEISSAGSKQEHNDRGRRKKKNKKPQADSDR